MTLEGRGRITPPNMIHTRETLLSAIQSCMDTKNLSLRSLAQQIGVTYDSLKDFRWGRTQMLRGDNLQKVVIFLGKNFRPTVPILGIVGAGGEVRPVDDHAQGACLEEVESPPGIDPSHVVALRIDGDSMHPAFQHGWVVYYSERMEIVAPPKDARLIRGPSPMDPLVAFFGKPCVVKLDDDRVLLKVLKRGHTNGRYTLTSYNAPDIEDASIEWAARVIFVKII
jgi:phage repressor protein C with HTH and peptisase S24 domain